MKISSLLLATLAASTSASESTTAFDDPLVARIRGHSMRGLRRLKKTEDKEQIDVATPETEDKKQIDVATPDNAAETKTEDTEEAVENADGSVEEKEDEEGEDNEGDEGKKGKEDEEEEDEEESDRSEWDAVIDDNVPISPTVWYSLGGVVAAIGIYCACFRKSDNGYASIQ